MSLTIPYIRQPLTSSFGQCGYSMVEPSASSTRSVLLRSDVPHCPPSCISGWDSPPSPPYPSTPHRDSPAIGQVERYAGLNVRPEAQVPQDTQADVQDGDNGHPHVEDDWELPGVLHLVFQRQHLGEEGRMITEQQVAPAPLYPSAPWPSTVPPCQGTGWSHMELCRGDLISVLPLETFTPSMAGPQQGHPCPRLNEGTCSLPLAGAVPTGGCVSGRCHLHYSLHPKTAQPRPTGPGPPCHIILFSPAGPRKTKHFLLSYQVCPGRFQPRRTIKTTGRTEASPSHLYY